MAVDDSDERRDRLDAFLREMGPVTGPDGCVLTGWVIVSEWMEPSGNRFLSGGWAAPVTEWAARGMVETAIVDRSVAGGVADAWNAIQEDDGKDE